MNFDKSLNQLIGYVAFNALKFCRVLKSLLHELQQQLNRKTFDEKKSTKYNIKVNASFLKYSSVHSIYVRGVLPAFSRY